MPNPNLCTGTFWYWNADPTPAGIRRELEAMKQAGYECVYIHPMPDHFRKGDFFAGMTVEYLGKKYFELIRAALAECRRLGLALMLYDEGGWPSGGVVGKLVKEHPEDRIRYIERDGRGGCREGVSGEPDLLSGSATRHFIELVYERYKAEVGDEFGKTVRGIFTDEPFWRHSLPREQIPVPKGLRAMLKNLHGSDFDAILPLLFPGPETAAAREARRQYTDVCTRLMAKNYSAPLAKWSRENGLAFEGHFDQEDSFYRGGGFNNPIKVLDPLDVPGVDAIWRQIYPGGETGHYARFAQAAAIRNRRREALCECFQVYGYALTSPVMHYVCNCLLTKGINRLLPMPFLYSDRGMHKVACSTDFSPSTPVWRVLPALTAFWNRAADFNTGALEPGVWVLAKTAEFGGAHPLDQTPRKLAYEKQFHAMLDRLDDALVFYRLADDEDLKKRKLPQTLLIPGELSEPELVALVERARNAGVEIVNGFEKKNFRTLSYLNAEPCAGIRLLPCRRKEGEALMLFNSGAEPQTLRFRAKTEWREFSGLDPALAAISPVTRADGFVNVPLPPGVLRILHRSARPAPEPKALHAKKIELAWTVRAVEQLRFSKDDPTKFERRKLARPLPAGGMYTEFEPGFSGVVELESRLVSEKGGTAWLVFDDVRHGAELSVNGEITGLRAFAPWAFRVRLKRGINRLKIKVFSSAGNEWRRCFREELEPAGWINSYGRRIAEYAVDDADCGISPSATLWSE